MDYLMDYLKKHIKKIINNLRQKKCSLITLKAILLYTCITCITS